MVHGYRVVAICCAAMMVLAAVVVAVTIRTPRSMRKDEPHG